MELYFSKRVHEWKKFLWRELTQDSERNFLLLFFFTINLFWDLIGHTFHFFFFLAVTALHQLVQKHNKYEPKQKPRGDESAIFLFLWRPYFEIAHSWLEESKCSWFLMWLLLNSRQVMTPPSEMGGCLNTCQRILCTIIQQVEGPTSFGCHSSFCSITCK